MAAYDSPGGHGRVRFAEKPLGVGRGCVEPAGQIQVRRQVLQWARTSEEKCGGMPPFHIIRSMHMAVRAASNQRSACSAGVSFRRIQQCQVGPLGPLRHTTGLPSTVCQSGYHWS